jgi:HK97 family phage prohead protease
MTNSFVLRGVTKAIGERQIRVIVSTADVDRSGDIIEPNGIDFSAYRKNPVILYQHDHDEPIARCAEIGVVNGRVEALIQFPDADASEDSDKVYNLIKAGVLNAVSIGFIPTEYIPLDPKEPWGPRKYVSCEMIEASIVSVPANSAALIIERQLPCNSNALIVERTIDSVNKEIKDDGDPDACPTCGQSIPVDPVEDGCGPDHKPRKSINRNQLALIKLK